MVVRIKPKGYRDRRVLDHFITAQGKIRARRLTKVSTKQHRAITKAIKKSRILARLPFMLSGVVERKIYAEELKIVSLEPKNFLFNAKKKSNRLDESSKSTLLKPSMKPKAKKVLKTKYEQGSYPLTQVQIETPSLKRKITRRTRIRTFAQARLGLREDIRAQYIRINKNLRKRNRRSDGRGRGKPARPLGSKAK